MNKPIECTVILEPKRKEIIRIDVGPPNESTASKTGWNPDWSVRHCVLVDKGLYDTILGDVRSLRSQIRQMQTRVDLTEENLGVDMKK